MTFDQFLNSVVETLDYSFPSESVKAALVLSFFSTCVVIGVFYYLNRFTKKTYFSLWTVSWLYFAAWLTASIQLEESPDLPSLIMARRAFMGISALCMFWGSFELTGARRRNRRELVLGIFMVLAWCGVAAYRIQDQLWITMPMFGLLAAASIYTGGLYLRLRTRYQGAGLLSIGFICMGVHLLLRPFIDAGPTSALTVSYVLTSILAIFIALSMIVQVLEQSREENETLVQAFNRGVATRRQMEQEAALSEEKYRALFESASDACFLVDLETFMVLEYNRAAQVFVGDNPSAGTSRSFLDLCPSLTPPSGKSLTENKRSFDEVFGPGKELPMTRANGTSIPCEGNATLVQYNRRSVLQINVREVTERKQLEQQLRRSEKLSALGQLTAGVAHELNNPLAVIMGYAQMLAKQTEVNPRQKADVLKILHETERAAKIVRNLLTFARPREPLMQSVDVNALIANVLETYEAEFETASIQVKCQLEPELSRTVADPVQIEQVLSNIILNAVQAMQTVQTARQLTLTTAVHDRMIRITMADTGVGITADVVTKIFDPFFTTRDPGKGTGLGLSIAHSIVHEHRGRIWVESVPGKGATFFVELPVVDRTVEERLLQPATPAPVDGPPKNKYRLLVVDDEPGINGILSAIFREAGYLVDSATNGNEALDMLERDRYDLIVADLCMPGVDGEALYKEVKERNPDLAARIIFVTGDLLSSKSRSFLDVTGNRWFSKPFNIAELEEVAASFLRD